MSQPEYSQHATDDGAGHPFGEGPTGSIHLESSKPPAPNVFGAYTAALDEKTRQFMEEAMASSQGSFPIKWLQTFIRRLASKDMELQDRERQMMAQYQQVHYNQRSQRFPSHPYRRRDNRSFHRGSNEFSGGSRQYVQRSNENYRRSGGRGRGRGRSYDYRPSDDLGQQNSNSVGAIYIPIQDKPEEIPVSSRQIDDDREDGECE